MGQVRNYIIVVQRPDHTNECVVDRIVQSPPAGTMEPDAMYDALAKTWQDFLVKYPLPRYDVIAARGDLNTIRTSLPECTGWNVQPEPIPGFQAAITR
ncbi:MAG: hypothetical protein HYX93_03080 [Chloroflexi bacterium]|nr:hypothetical protein [Chloroflexota bacterium]